MSKKKTQVSPNTRNHCPSCGHEWKPRKQAMSERCPRCRRVSVALEGKSVLPIILVLLVLLYFILAR